ncbi:MAG: nicotinamide-nucleotide amidohydrolase family protein, partial [Bacillota bacterium]|nr:nicotinamide-nucleotide amidohydrolase family protein [Bacillota bacterium]
KVRDILGDVVYGIDVSSLEEVAVNLLRDRKLTLATAESCTGGLLSKRITDIPGSSECFLGGVCAYSNEVKTKLLGVPEELIKEKGAVSAEVAAKMAEGARLSLGASIGVGITGVAGPGGGTEEKPVGLIYVALSTADKMVVTTLNNKRSRDRNRLMAASTALDMVRRHIASL